MLSQKSTMKTKLENMYLQKRISYGYRKVINMMQRSRSGSKNMQN